MGYKTSFTFEGRRYYIRGNTLKELDHKVAQKKRELKEAKNPPSILFKDWSIECVETYKNGCKMTTYQSYLWKAEHLLNQYIGDIPLDKLSALDCQKCINHQANMSEYTINQAIILLKFILNRAIDNGYITKNPANSLVKPKGYKDERRALTEEEREKLKQEFNDPRYLIFEIMYYTGARSSEAANLLGSDLQGNLLHIRGTKTKKADRYVPIPDHLIQKIKNTMPTDYICTSPSGLYLNKHRISDLWYYLRKRLNLPQELVPYCLRHDYCTRLVEQEIPMVYAIYLLGHTDSRMIVKTYAHISKEMVANIVVR